MTLGAESPEAKAVHDALDQGARPWDSLDEAEREFCASVAAAVLAAAVPPTAENPQAAHLLRAVNDAIDVMGPGTDEDKDSAANMAFAVLQHALETLPAAGRAAATPDPPDAESLARMFHDSYEALAPSFGYITREASAVAWENVPADNKALMISTARAVLRKLSLRPASPDERLREALRVNALLSEQLEEARRWHLTAVNEKRAAQADAERLFTALDGYIMARITGTDLRDYDDLAERAARAHRALATDVPGKLDRTVLDPETGIEEPVTTGRIPDAEFVEPPLMPPASSPDERLREAAQVAVFACLPVLHIVGSQNRGYRVSDVIDPKVIADPQEWVDAAHAICELHHVLAAADRDTACTDRENTGPGGAVTRGIVPRGTDALAPRGPAGSGGEDRPANPEPETDT